MRKLWKILLRTGALLTCGLVSSTPSAANPQSNSTGATANNPGKASQQQSNTAIRNASTPSQKFSERGLARRNLWFPVYSRKHTPVNPTKIKSVTIETQISSGTPMSFPPGWRDDLLQNQVTEQIWQLSKSATGTVTEGRYAVAAHGSMLICRESPVTVYTEKHDISVAANAIAYVIRAGEELAVYNLASNRNGDITVKAAGSKQVYDVLKGHALILTDASDFSGSTLGKFISCRRPWLIAKEGKLNVFGADFSYLNVLDRCPQFQSGLASTDRNQRKLSNRLLKLSAARILNEAGP
ncbi:MAG: hypothetical protein K2W95_09850 [Candidatus Obscuribacterales bacterium]|nr:hypothetical protein [Candidatus Obscuribacterales bacterium]